MRPSTASGSALSGTSGGGVSSQASEPALESGVSALTICSGSDGKNGSGQNGQSSAGRGTTRGRRDRADDMLVRTRPNDMESKVNGRIGKLE